jgi:hypothetical protein
MNDTATARPNGITVTISFELAGGRALKPADSGERTNAISVSLGTVIRRLEMGGLGELDGFVPR